jgi:hypothetical protein
MSLTGEKICSEKFYGKISYWISKLRTFGEIGIVSDKKTKKIQGKLDDRGLPCLWVGYPTNHAEDVYKFVNLRTKKMIMHQNIIWLDKNDAEFKSITVVNIEQITPVEVDQEEVQEIEEIEDNVAVPVTPSKPAGRISRELKGLMEYNRDPVRTGEAAEVAMLNQAFCSKPFYGDKALISALMMAQMNPRTSKRCLYTRTRRNDGTPCAQNSITWNLKQCGKSRNGKTDSQTVS